MATNNSVDVGLSGATGTGNFVGANTPTLITPVLGTPTSGTLTNCTGLPVAGGGTGLSTATAYAVLCGGTTSTGAFQSIASVGTSGQVLTSNGAGALPTFQAAGSGGNALLNVQTFTSTGTYTPTSGMTYCVILCWGGGGAGGGTPTIASGSNVYMGGAGGSGGFSQGFESSASIGASKAVTIGAAGAGSAGALGGNGGDTSVGTLVIAKGGTGGPLGTSSGGTTSIKTGGAGGIAGTGNISNFAGNAGNLSVNDATASLVIGGQGANTTLQNGAASVTLTNNGGTVGNAATANTGSGGSGAMAWGTGAGPSQQAGGNGGSGFVIIYEYGS